MWTKPPNNVFEKTCCMASSRTNEKHTVQPCEPTRTVASTPGSHPGATAKGRDRITEPSRRVSGTGFPGFPVNLVRSYREDYADGRFLLIYYASPSYIPDPRDPA